MRSISHKSPFRREMRHRDQHFAHGDAAVLEGVAIVADVIVVVVWIGKEITLTSEDKGCAEVGLR